MKKRMFGLVAFMLALALVFAGCGGSESDGGSGKKPGKGGSAAAEEEKRTIEGNDVFAGDRFNEMIWGYYEEEGYDYTGSNEDTAQFREGMKYFELEGRTLSALPLSMQAGQYTHFMSSFTYEGKYYDAYTEEGRAKFRKAYIEQVGDLTEEQFQKIEKIFWLDVAELTFAEESGAVRMYTFSYEIQGNKILFSTFSIDDDYNITTSEKPVLECEFLHDGGKLILASGKVQRSYLASGYKETDSSLVCSGYALNDGNRYEDLDGFSFYQYGQDSEASVYVSLTGGESPYEPKLELDVATGNFTLSWQERWVEREGRTVKEEDPTTITGTMVPCTSYGFTDYAGFFLFIDGNCYRYLMSEQEYEERMYAGVPEDASSGEREDYATAKRNLLAELAAAFKAAGIDVTIDFNSGKIDLEANFLFGTDSYALSAEGQAYIDAFMDVYVSVVMHEDYAEFVSNIVVEGHTDTAGSYSYNQELSQKRAEAVAERCIERNPKMENVIKAEGCSYDYPVYNDNGTVNMEKSRRVTFSFVLGSR